MALAGLAMKCDLFNEGDRVAHEGQKVNQEICEHGSPLGEIERVGAGVENVVRLVACLNRENAILIVD